MTSSQTLSHRKRAAGSHNLLRRILRHNKRTSGINSLRAGSQMAWQSVPSEQIRDAARQVMEHNDFAQCADVFSKTFPKQTLTRDFWTTFWGKWVTASVTFLTGCSRPQQRLPAGQPLNLHHPAAQAAV